MKRMIAMVMAFIWGSLVAFFGVFVSVFADGGWEERLVTILVILCIYLISGGIWGYGGPFWSWQWGLLLSAPAVLILILYGIKETDILPLGLAYMAAILFFSWAGATLGRRFRIKQSV